MKRLLMISSGLLVLLFFNLSHAGMFDKSEVSKDIDKETLNKIQKVIIDEFTKETVKGYAVKFDSQVSVVVNDFKITRIKKVQFAGETGYAIQGEISFTKTLLRDSKIGSKGHSAKEHDWFRCEVSENAYGDLRKQNLAIYSKNPSQ